MRNLIVIAMKYVEMSHFVRHDNADELSKGALYLHNNNHSCRRTYALLCVHYGESLT
jgi:hypothetical protein